MCQRWTETQKQIYAGLKEIGDEVAGYFKSALTYYYNASLANRVSHLAHAAREIDGSLRDIFSSKALKEKIKRNLITKSIKEIFGNEFEDSKGHIASILVTLDVDEKDSLAQEWISIATKFAKYAHRSGAWKTERSFDEFKPLWERYEYVLSRLVGSYYAMISRIDRLLTLNEITDASIGALSNLLVNKPYSVYFFARVKSLKWFDSLKENKYFDPQGITSDEKGFTHYWIVLNYLERVSKQTSQNPEYGKKLIDVINDIIQFSKTKSRINQQHIWWCCVKILNNLPNEIIKQNLAIDDHVEQGEIKYGFRTWLAEWTDHDSSSSLTIGDITEKLLPKFLHDKDMLQYAEVILEVITQIQSSGENNSLTNRDEAKLFWDTYWIIKVFRDHAKEIGQKCSTDLIYKIANKLKDALQYERRSYQVPFKIGNDIYHIEISRTFKEGLRNREIGFQSNAFKGIISQSSPNQILHSFSFEAGDKKSMSDQIKQNLPKKINWHQTQDFERKIDDLYQGLNDDYSRVWLKSLSVAEEVDHISDTEEVLSIILKDVLLAKCEVNKTEGRKTLEDFLTNKYSFPIFKRLVLLCIDRDWKSYEGLFDVFLESTPNPLQEPNFEVELYDLFKNHEKRFKELLNNKLLQFINEIPDGYKREGKKVEGRNAFLS